MNFTLNQEQYESLVALSRRGVPASDVDAKRRLEEWLKTIERQNGVTRDLVVVLWQEMDTPLRSGTFFPTKWPPELKHTIELVTRPVARADVDAVLAAHAKNPTSVMCTRDPEGILGLTPIDAFFPQ
jgi:hypothetical protein